RGSLAESTLSLEIFRRRSHYPSKVGVLSITIQRFRHLTIWGFPDKGSARKSVRETSMASAAHQFRPVPPEGAETYRSLNEDHIGLAGLASTSRFEEIVGSS